MKARTFDLEDHHIAFLDTHHSNRTSRSELVRLALDAYIAEHARWQELKEKQSV
jgi:metal-responsive CopG/Arc/MetJ family transcriptional regulator